MTTRQLRLFGTVLIAAITAGVSSAAAHSFPQEQNPSAGQTLSASPPGVSIRYDAPIEKLFAKIEVLDANGKNEVVGEPEIGPDGVTLSVKVGALEPGEYTVKWSVIGIDTHHTQGSYQFTVASGGS